MGSQELPRRGRPEDSRSRLLARFTRAFEVCGSLGALGTVWMEPLDPTAENKGRLSDRSLSGYMAILGGGLMRNEKGEHRIGIASVTSFVPDAPLNFWLFRKSVYRDEDGFVADCFINPASTPGVTSQDAQIYNYASSVLSRTSFRSDITREFMRVYCDEWNPGTLAIPTTDTFFRDAPEMIAWQQSAAYKVREK